jgi:hypothetical protein
VESNIAQKSIKLLGNGLFQKFPKMPSKDLTNMVSKWNLLRMMALGMLVIVENLINRTLMDLEIHVIQYYS